MILAEFSDFVTTQVPDWFQDNLYSSLGIVVDECTCGGINVRIRKKQGIPGDNSEVR
jgi:hypothetical protein